MLGGSNAICGPIRCITCLQPVADFAELERHHLAEHGCHPKDAHAGKWTAWRRLHVLFMDWAWCKDYARQSDLKVEIVPLWVRLVDFVCTEIRSRNRGNTP